MPGNPAAVTIRINIIPTTTNWAVPRWSTQALESRCISVLRVPMYVCSCAIPGTVFQIRIHAVLAEKFQNSCFVLTVAFSGAGHDVPVHQQQGKCWYSCRLRETCPLPTAIFCCRHVNGGLAAVYELSRVGCVDRFCELALRLFPSLRWRTGRRAS